MRTVRERERDMERVKRGNARLLLSEMLDEADTDYYSVVADYVAELVLASRCRLEYGDRDIWAVNDAEMAAAERRFLARLV